MTATRRRLRRLSRPGSQLVYLLLYPAPFFWETPSLQEAAGALLGLLVFLPIYFGPCAKGSDARILRGAAALIVVAAAVSFTGANWTVFFIYAAAMTAEVRLARPAPLALGFLAAGAAFGMTLQADYSLVAAGLFITLLAGLAVSSRLALERKNKALQAAQRQVREMAAATERERIARDLHDLLGRTLTVMALKANLATRLAHSDAARAKAEMQEVANAARGALAEVREAVSGMTHASIERELVASTGALAAAGIAFTVQGMSDNISLGTGAVLAMALREAVTNVVRHSQADTCTICLERDARKFLLTVSDNGKGWDGVDGNGLAGLRARLSAAGGYLQVVSGERGTHVRAAMPRNTAR